MSSTPDPIDAAEPDDAATAEAPAEAVEVEVVEVEVGVLDALLIDLVEDAVDAEGEAEAEAEAVVEVEAVEVIAQAEVVEPDPSLFEAHDLALAALREITTEASIGEPADYRVEPDGVVSLRFTNRLPGYPGWFWTVSLARVEGSEPTVLEVELLPGDGALLAPDWVPWAVRLAEYHAAQAALAELAHAEDDDEDEDAEEDLDDVDDLDAADFDDDGSPILHAGDVDGVDIDVLDASAEDEDESDDEDDDSDDDEDSDEDEDEDEDDSDDDEDDSRR
jgi:hypothetical protein